MEAADPTPSSSPVPEPGTPTPPVDVPVLAPGDEIIEDRTESSRTYDLGDGLRAVEVFPDPVHYQPDGPESPWEPIEVGFAPVAGADKAAVSRVAPSTVAVAPAADERGFLRVSDQNGFTVGLRAVVPKAFAGRTERVREPEVSDAVRADIEDLFPGADARVLAHADGAKVFLVLAERPAVAAWTFALDLPKGAMLRASESNGLDVLDASGARRMVMPAPYAVDSTPDALTGSGRTTSALHYELGEQEGRPTVTVVVDDGAWLDQAVYPVYVDPTIYDIWGNIHYGYVGRAHRIPRNLLVWGARDFGGGFDAGDEITVRLGMDLWDRHGDALTRRQLRLGIVAAIPKLRRATQIHVVAGLTEKRSR